MTEYHQAPYTLDPSKKPPENPEEVAPASGHDDEMSEKVAELQAEHKQGVEEAAQSAQERAESDTPEAPYPAGHAAGAPPEEAEPTEGEDPKA